MKVEELIMKTHNVSLLILLVAISGCGTMPEERAISGAGIGAASGAIMGAVTGLAVGPGALIGALGGGLVGALTNKDQVNMGEPAWKKGRASSTTLPPVQDATRPAAPAQSANPELVARVQQRLAWLGYQPGPADGIYGRRTAAAIRAFQKDHGMDVDGMMTTALADRVLGTPKTGAFSI